MACPRKDQDLTEEWADENNYKPQRTLEWVMFDNPNNAFLLELFLEHSRAKNCRKISFRKKIPQKVNPVCIEQNKMREAFMQITPREMESIEDTHYGVDYIYRGIKIDQKFSFGGLGKDTIKIRVKNRRLVNNSDWTMIINETWGLEFFETRKLEAFVRKNWALVQKRLVEKKQYYAEYSIKLNELYTLEEISPIRTHLQKEALIDGLTQIEFIENEKELPQTQLLLEESMPKRSVQITPHKSP